MKKNTQGMGLYVIIILLISAVLMVSKFPTKTVDTAPYEYSNLIQDVEKGNVISKIVVETDSDVNAHGIANVYFVSNPTAFKTIEIPDIASFMTFVHSSILSSNNVSIVKTLPISKTSWIMRIILPISIVVGVVILLFLMFQKMQGNAGGGNKAMSFGKSKAKLITPDKNRTTFKDVAGLKEEKVELEEIVEFLREPKKYLEIGARIPKGILLVGPPGTGKTLLAKAVAGEATSPFFSISGSDFVEMFVGVGASRVRDLFEQAKKNSPCLIFIDEIDAVGRRRGAGLGGGHDEREQTLNQLLTEMDGFGINEGIIILAATNRADILDPALLRPGRFDRQVAIGYPDVLGREEILQVHSKGKKFAEDVDLKVVAQTTSGFTGADLENLLNESALISARENLKLITMESIKKAFIKVGIGTEKRSRIVSPKDKKITAYHEAGHAILFEILEELDSVHIVSIIPTGWAGGYTMPLPSHDRSYQTKTHMIQNIMSLLGGRIAEDLILHDITTGASNDIEKATAIARSMVTKFGMSKSLGPIQFGNDDHDVFLGKDISQSRNYGENIATKIDDEIRAIITKAYDDVEVILKDNIDILHKAANLLLEKEKITGQEFRALFPEGKLIKKESLVNLSKTFLN